MLGVSDLMPLQKIRLAHHLDRLDSGHRATADWSEMGTGKSPVALCTAQALKAKRILYVGPAVMLMTFSREVERWTDLAPTRIVGGKPTLPERTGVVLMSYDTMRRQAARLAKARWDMVIFDEHHALKSREAKRTRIAIQVVAPTATSIMLLSGTPAPNHYGELWTTLRAFFPETVQAWTRKGFLSMFCHQAPSTWGTDGTQITGSKNGPRLRALINGVFTRDKLADVWRDDPGKSLSLHYIAVADCPRIAIERAAEEYERLQDEYLEEDLCGDEIHISTYRRLIGEAKAPPTADLVRGELDLGLSPRLLLFYHHRSVGDILQTSLGDLATRIDGRTGQTDRNHIIDTFQDGDGPPILLAQTQVMNAGLTLTAASRVLIAEPDWVPGVNHQAIARCHRIGQRNHVHARMLAVADTLDEVIVSTIARKTQELMEILP
jgi:SWI/SNF-related matrix-associated actin-dependent regulator 1 of chromatin subfamily A